MNLGNIAPDEVIPLETLRLGLRGDTFFQYLPEEMADKLRQSQARVTCSDANHTILPCQWVRPNTNFAVDHGTEITASELEAWKDAGTAPLPT